MSNLTRDIAKLREKIKNQEVIDFVDLKYGTI